MKTGMEILRPLLVETGVEPVAKVALGTVKGDLHDIGKNLVGMMLEGGGFEVIDLGVDVSPDKYLEAVQSNEVKVIGLSALLTTTMLNMKDTIHARVLNEHHASAWWRNANQKANSCFSSLQNYKETTQAE